jgi:hypothetical protein
MLLDEFISALPRASARPALTPTSQIAQVTQENTQFVAPSLTPLVALRDGETSLVVVSAAAAVGKSTVGRHIAYATNALLWDLSGRKVGTESLTGALTNAFGRGTPQASRVFRNLEEGRVLVVLDALDETLLGSGASNFEEFLEDVVQLSAKPRARAALLLLARSDTAELIELALQIGSVPYAHYRIDFFDRLGAIRFVERALAGRGKSGKPYAASRERLFKLVYGLLEAGLEPWANQDVVSFLGYAPVLQTIADYLDVRNPIVRANEFERATEALGRGGTVGSWDFLSRLIQDLLERERTEKVLPALQQRMGPKAAATGWSDWPSLFRPDEQTRRVLKLNLGAKLPPDPSSHLPAQLRPDYEQAIAEWLADHVFRGPVAGYANVAFRDYSYAQELALSGPLAASVRERMREPGYLPTPLLARFLLQMCPVDGGDPVVPGELVGFVNESLTSQVATAGSLELQVWTDDRDDVTRGALFSRGTAKETEFRISSKLGSRIWFWRRLAYAQIHVRGAVELGSEGHPLLLGPSVLVESDQIKSSASEVFVTTRKDQDVELTAGSFDPSSPVPLRIEHEGDGVFQIDWPSPDYRWFPYSLERPANGPISSTILSDFHLLRSALRRFRSQGFGPLARHQDIIDRIVFGNNLRGQALVRFLLREGILSRSSGLYVLNRERLNALGINWSDVTQYKIGGEVAELLRRFDRASS